MSPSQLGKSTADLFQLEATLIRRCASLVELLGQVFPHPEENNQGDEHANMTAALGLYARASATSSLTPYDYCSGQDSICSAFKGLDRDCADQNGADYYECICVSGWVSANIACGYCMYALGLTERVTDSRNFTEICSEEGFTIAPMPSSIVSEQKARNKTVEVPEPEPETTSDSTFTFDMPRKTTIEPETMTFYGTPTASLPDIRPTNSNDGPSRYMGVRQILVFTMAFSLSIVVCV
ncbi:hypothetical protein NM208_g6326 [Fusarium decemcellulare]|uniref:Uncharacterized protein n=1 Tax=Fusarium decemcellulare TaxID=57161 RepID=A0ACC1SDC9_9HYPO|nr:hypothetical protein NM208_g6326 [Fusarium decemcellulare]